MHSTKVNSEAKRCLSISDTGPEFSSTNLAAGALCIRAFFERVGACANRNTLTRAVLSALLVSLLVSFSMIAARPAEAQTETVLYNFCSQPNCNDGQVADSLLTRDPAGNLYGTTEFGGTSGAGAVFELSPDGGGGWNETVLYSFSGGVDGRLPLFSCVLFDSVGNLYGTTSQGGVNGTGVVFELSPAGTSWTETVLYSFARNFAGFPVNGLVMDATGNLYGNSSEGIFELSPSGGGWTEQMIYDIDHTATNNAGLTMDSAGNIYGSSLHTVFELSPNGDGGWNSIVIYTFPGGGSQDGGHPSTPIADRDGNLYGTTTGNVNVRAKNPKNHGSVYQLSPGPNGWKKKTLYQFKSGADGNDPVAGLVLDAAGNLYGTTKFGGTFGAGTVFQVIAPVGKSKVYNDKILWSFNVSDGFEPEASLILDSNGNLYGTVANGGLNGGGVVFKVTP
jgi:uncharacterized repeat protein (TIGR03803 family)